MNSVIPCNKGPECNWPACPQDCEGRPGAVTDLRGTPEFAWFRDQLPSMSWGGLCFLASKYKGHLDDLRPHAELLDWRCMSEPDRVLTLMSHKIPTNPEHKVS
jgi:hypothetical protein